MSTNGTHAWEKPHANCPPHPCWILGHGWSFFQWYAQIPKSTLSCLLNHYRAGNPVTRPLPCILPAATITQISFCPPPPPPDKYQPSLLYGKCYTTWKSEQNQRLCKEWIAHVTSVFLFGQLLIKREIRQKEPKRPKRSTTIKTNRQKMHNDPQQAKTSSTFLGTSGKID